MSTLKPTKKISRRQELRQDTVVTTYTRFLDFFDNNRQLVYGVLAGIILILLAILFWRYTSERKSEAAEMESVAAIRLFEQGEYQLALDGVVPDLGLVEIADKYGSTKAGNLAHFYAASAYVQLNNPDEALEHFRKFSKSDDFISASALAGEADILESRGEHRDAAILFARAAALYDSGLTSPNYLLSAGRSYEAAGMYTKALESYQEIKERYSDSAAAEKVDIYISRAEALSNS